MPTSAIAIESALYTALPPELHASVPAFVGILDSVIHGTLSSGMAFDRISADSTLVSLLQNLAGHTLAADTKEIVFDTSGQISLRDSGMEPKAIIPPVSLGFINQPIGSVEQVFGDQRTIHTDGGDYIKGNKIINQAEQAYDVRGLPNPYLGLRSFTYADRASYAGRQNLVDAAVEFLTAPGEQHVLLFITGASGSGKSSFAQAGLIRALEEYYQRRAATVRWAVFRPSRHPLAGLSDALLQLGIPSISFDPLDLAQISDSFQEAVRAPTPPQQINLLILDQFEELFTQAEPAERDALFAVLENLPPFATLNTHIITTLRADYLPELFTHKTLYDQAKQGIDLRAMTIADLKEAIQCPLHSLAQQMPQALDHKRFEDALLEKLARDTAEDAAYLPLLQVTLEDLWTHGHLMLGFYGTLTDAIRQRAEPVYSYVDHRGGLSTARSDADKATIMRIFLDLIDVSLDDDAHRDVRRRRRYDELSHGQADRARLIDDLVSARLLSQSLETRDETAVDVVDIIHETLISNWERLRNAIGERRTVLRQRVRFEQALQEWQAAGCNSEYLLNGVRLAEAQALHEQGDIALHNPTAQDLLKRSIDAREAERQHKLEQEQALAEEKRRRAADRRNVLQLRAFLVVAGILLLITFISIGYALWSQQDAAQQAKRTAADIADAQRVASQADAKFLVNQDDPLVPLLVLSAIHKPEYAKLPVISLALRHIFELTSGYSKLKHTDRVTSVAWSPDGEHILTGSADDNYGRIWNARTRVLELVLKGHTDLVWSVAWRPDGAQVVTAGKDHTVRIWDTASGAEVQTLNEAAWVWSVAWSPDGRQLLVSAWDMDAHTSTIHIYDATTARLRTSLVCLPTANDEQAVLSVAWKHDGTQVAAGRNDGNVCVWDAVSGKLLFTYKATGTEVRSIAWNQAGTQLLTASIDRLAATWDATDGHQLQVFIGHSGPVRSAAWSPDGRHIITGSDDGTARLWDVASGQEISRLEGHARLVWAVAWHPTKQLVVTGSFDTTAHIWVADTNLMVAKLTQTVCQHFTDDQIRADIPTWNGCTEQLKAIQDELNDYDALGITP